MFVATTGITNATLNQANGCQIISIKAIHANDEAHFKAFVTAFTDKFTTNYNSEEVYGRMDPVQMYKGTQRVITISFDVPSESQSEAELNQRACAALARMQYPVYAGASATSMQASPMFKIKFGNLINNSSGGGGLIGTLSGFNYEVDTDAGFFIEDNNYYPKTVKLSLEFTVQHTHQVGYGGSNAFMDSFPYNVGTADPASPSYNSVEGSLSAEDKQINQENLDNQALQQGNIEDPEKQQDVIDRITSPGRDFAGNIIRPG